MANNLQYYNFVESLRAHSSNNPYIMLQLFLRRKARHRHVQHSRHTHERTCTLLYIVVQTSYSMAQCKCLTQKLQALIILLIIGFLLMLNPHALGVPIRECVQFGMATIGQARLYPVIRNCNCRWLRCRQKIVLRSRHT